MVLSEYWKRLEKKFWKRLFSQFPKIVENYKNLFSPAISNIVKEPLLVQEQTTPQQKALDLSFNLTPWKWAWHHQEGATPSRREKHRSAWGKKSCFTARGSDSLMIVPRPLSGCQIKAEIKGFLLRYCLFQYKHWFFPNFDLNHFPDSAFTPCRKIWLLKLKIQEP